MRFLLAGLALTTLGCSETATRPESRPIATRAGGGGQVEMAVDPEGPRPIARPRLVELWPSLGSLSEPQLQNFSSAVNIMPSPCGECSGLPIAHCLERGNEASKPVLSKLFKRAETLAQLDRPAAQIKAAINYPDTWFDGLGTGTPVHVVLYRDSEGAFASSTSETLEVLQKEFGDSARWSIHDRDVVAPEHIGVRSRPTWFINGHRFRGAQSSRILSRYIGFEILDAQE